MHLQFHVTDRSPLHLLNVPVDIITMFFGKETSCSPLLQNAYLPISLMLEKSNCVKFGHSEKQWAEIASHLQFHVTDRSPLHLLNVPHSRISMFFGKQTSCSPLSLKAYCPTFFMAEKSKCFNLVHL